MRSLWVLSLCVTAVVTSMLSVPSRASGGVRGAFEARCEAELLPTQVSVVWVPGEVNFDYSRGIRALMQVNHMTQPNALLGLTESSMGSHFAVSMSALRDTQSGRSCMRPQIEVRVSAGSQKIFVANDFPQGSCAFEQILTHELQHARANDESARHTAAVLETMIRSELGNRVFYGEEAALQSQLSARVREAWWPLAQRSLSNVNAEHARIDDPAENRRVLDSCEGELARTLRAAMI